MPTPDASAPDSSLRVEAALALLRDQGERVTPARRAVLTVVDQADLADEHLTADEIGARVAELEPSVHRATVYRTLTSLAEAGALSHVHVGGAATVYHLATPADPAGTPDPADPARPPSERTAGPAAYGHVHVRCVDCGKVLDAPPGLLDTAAAQLRDTLGFELESTHAALLGRCADCR